MDFFTLFSFRIIIQTPRVSQHYVIYVTLNQWTLNIVLQRYLLSERIKCSIWYRNSFSECDSTATKSPPLNRLQKNWKRKKNIKRQTNQQVQYYKYVIYLYMRCRQFNLSHSFASIRSLFLLSVCTCIFTPTFQCLWPTMGFEDFPLKLGAQRTICTLAIRQNYLFLLQDDNLHVDQWNKCLPSITSKLSLFFFR